MVREKGGRRLNPLRAFSPLLLPTLAALSQEISKIEQRQAEILAKIKAVDETGAFDVESSEYTPTDPTVLADLVSRKLSEKRPSASPALGGSRSGSLVKRMNTAVAGGGESSQAKRQA